MPLRKRKRKSPKARNPLAQQAWKRKAGPMTSPNKRRQKGKEQWRESDE